MNFWIDLILWVLVVIGSDFWIDLILWVLVVIFVRLFDIWMSGVHCICIILFFLFCCVLFFKTLQNVPKLQIFEPIGLPVEKLDGKEWVFSARPFSSLFSLNDLFSVQSL